MSNLLELPQTAPSGGGTDDRDDLLHLRCMSCGISPCGIAFDESEEVNDAPGELKCVVCFSMWQLGQDSDPCQRCGQ